MNESTEQELAVHVSHLKRSFHGKSALDAVNLKIPRGSIHGLVGLNGAGKTTLIRHLIGSLRAESGEVRVLGQNPVKNPEGVLKQIGYMTEEDSLPKWMRVGELIDFCRAIYPSWDELYAKELAEMFSLSRQTKLKSLSKGQRARAGLLVAISHRPLLLILDEPSSGLDPIARSDILEAIIRTISNDGRTVLFSSHLLDEVDRVCDRISLLHSGKILDTLRSEDREDQMQELTFQTSTSWEPPSDTERCFGWRQAGNEWSVVLASKAESSIPTFKEITLVQRRPVSLQRWFEARVAKRPVEIMQNQIRDGVT